MAGNIQNVNIALLKAKYEDYCQKVNEIGGDFHRVYIGVLNLDTFWTGKRVNAIIEKYNSVSKTLVEHYHFFDTTVRSALLEIISQYESMENKGIAEDLNLVGLTQLDFIADPIKLTTTENVKFEQDGALKYTNQIEDNLQDLGNKLPVMISILDEFKTYSDSLNKLVTNYTAAAESIISTLSQIKETLRAEVESAVKVVQTTEGYNDSDASRVQS